MLSVTARASRAPHAPRTAQAGLTLVELMVGMAVGLFIIAGATLLTTTQLSGYRQLLAETQLQQDLRATADIITRELRRAGSMEQANRAVWGPAPGAAAVPNPYAEVTLTGAPANDVAFSYYRAPGETGPFGFRLRQVGTGANARGVVQTLLAGGGWQDLTDGGVMDVTGFTVTPRNGPPTVLVCPKECAGGGTACWPSHAVRELVVDIAAQSRADATVQRSIRTVVRLRNDRVDFNDAAAPNQICPT